MKWFQFLQHLDRYTSSPDVGERQLSLAVMTPNPARSFEAV